MLGRKLPVVTGVTAPPYSRAIEDEAPQPFHPQSDSRPEFPRGFTVILAGAFLPYKAPCPGRHPGQDPGEEEGERPSKTTLVLPLGSQKPFLVKSKNLALSLACSSFLG